MERKDPSEGHPAIKAEEFSFTYPTLDGLALEAVSFDVEPGEVLGVVGPVEAGKTTLSMALAGFAPRHTGGTTDGDLSVAGRDPREARDNRVAMVFEDYAAQLTQVRVIDEVVAPLTNRGIPRSEAVDRARELLDRVRLSGLEEQFSWELSGGQQQRLALAAALAIDPEVLIFDTATDMLDPAGREEVANLIASLKGEVTLVVTENDPDALVGVADRLMVLDDGERVALGPADELLRNVDLLESVGVDPPICRQIAREVDLSGSPLTPGEFLDVLEAETGGDEADAMGVRPKAANGGSVSVAPGFGDPVIEAENATYRYTSDSVAVDGVDLSVQEGEVHAVIGGNGSGKTTLSKLLVGLFEPDEGRVLLSGEPTRDRTARDLAESVGITLQNPDEQLSEQTVEKELRFPLKSRRYERTRFLRRKKRERYDETFIEQRIETVSELVGLPDELHGRDPMFLPRGMRRLVAMAGALAPDPDALILDEPVAGVDATARKRVQRTIQQLREQGKAVVVIDHDMGFICDVADTVTVLEDGEVAKQGPIHEVFADANWEWLSSRHLRPPLAARLARRLGIDALTADELVGHLQPRLEVPG
ncbi:MAG: ABC transporter ATP-binding protein [Halobacteriales archaeon]